MTDSNIHFDVNQCSGICADARGRTDGGTNSLIPFD